MTKFSTDLGKVDVVTWLDSAVISLLEGEGKHHESRVTNKAIVRKIISLQHHEGKIDIQR
jgi:hypothetical protein